MPRAKAETTPVKRETDVIVISESPPRAGVKKRVVKTEQEDIVDVIDNVPRVVKRVVRTITTEEFIEVLPAKTVGEAKNLLKPAKVIKKTTAKKETKGKTTAAKRTVVAKKTTASAKAKTTTKTKASTTKTKATAAKPKASNGKAKTPTTKARATSTAIKTTTVKKAAASTRAKTTTAKSKATTTKTRASTKTKMESTRAKATSAKAKATPSKTTSSTKTKAALSKAKASTTKTRATTAKPKTTATNTSASTTNARATPAKTKSAATKTKASTTKTYSTPAKPSAAKSKTPTNKSRVTTTKTTPTATKRKPTTLGVKRTIQKPKTPVTTRPTAVKAEPNTAQSPLSRMSLQPSPLDANTGLSFERARVAQPRRRQPQAPGANTNGFDLRTSLLNISNTFTPQRSNRSPSASLTKQEPSAIAGLSKTSLQPAPLNASTSFEHAKVTQPRKRQPQATSTNTNGFDFRASLLNISNLLTRQRSNRNAFVPPPKQEPSEIASSGVLSRSGDTSDTDVDDFAWHVSYHVNNPLSGHSALSHGIAVMCTRNWAVSETQNVIGSPWGMSWEAVCKLPQLKIVIDDEDSYVVRCIINQVDVTVSSKRIYIGAERWIVQLRPHGHLSNANNDVGALLSSRSQVFGPYAVREQAIMEARWHIGRIYEALRHGWEGDMDRFARVVFNSNRRWVLSCNPPSERQYDVVVRQLGSGESCVFKFNSGQDRVKGVAKGEDMVGNMSGFPHYREISGIPREVPSGSRVGISNAGCDGVWIVSVTRNLRKAALLPQDKWRSHETVAIVSTRASAIRECERALETDIVLGWNGKLEVGKTTFVSDEKDSIVQKWTSLGSSNSSVTVAAKLAYANKDTWIVEKTLRKENEVETHCEYAGPFVGRQQAIHDGVVKMKTEVSKVFGAQWDTVKNYARAVVDTPDKWELRWKALNTPVSVTVTARQMVSGENVSILRKRQDELERMKKKTAAQVSSILARHRSGLNVRGERNVASSAATWNDSKAGVMSGRNVKKEAEEDFMMF